MECCLLNSTKWISVHGTKYKVGAIVHVGFDDGEFPQFCEIVEIVVINNEVSKAMFVVSGKETEEKETFTKYCYLCRVKLAPENVAKITPLFNTTIWC